MAIRLEERAGWLAVRTSEFPAGDLAGAAKASLALATYHLALLQHDKGRQWLDTALAEAPKDNTRLLSMIEHNMIQMQKCLELMSDTSHCQTLMSDTSHCQTHCLIDLSDLWAPLMYVRAAYAAKADTMQRGKKRRLSQLRRIEHDDMIS